MPRYRAVWHDCIPWLDGGYADRPDRAALEGLLRTAYRAALGSVDDVLYETLTGLRRAGVLDDIDLIVVGDHGEAFGEHRSLCHGFHLHDEVTRVPLIVLAKDRLPAPRVVLGGCGLIDVAPTILDLAGVQPATELPGHSLLGLGIGPDAGWPIVADMERPRGTLNGSIRTEYVSVRTPAMKWIASYDPLTGKLLQEEVYDLATDPGEMKPLATDGSLPDFAAADFCLAVARERNRIRRLAGLLPVEPVCPPKR